VFYGGIRWKHLKTLLSVLHPVVQRQQISYQVFVAEQVVVYKFFFVRVSE
jgi:hypothetical protein